VSIRPLAAGCLPDGNVAGALQVRRAPFVVSIRSGIAAGALVVAGLTPRPAGAQAAPDRAASAPEVAQPPPADSETPAPPTTPVPPVSDPMLASPPDVPTKILSWADALSLVRSRSPDYAANLQNIQRAAAQAREALASLLPVVTGQATYTHSFEQLAVPFNGAFLVTPPPNVFGVGGVATWTPVNLRAIHDYETARRSIDVAELSFEEERRQIATGVVATMLATLSAARVAELDRVGLRSSLERLHLTEARLQYGQGTPLDVDRAAKDVASARRAIIDGDESLRRARESLGVVLGSGEPVTVSTDLELEGFERAVADTCKLNEAIERRPDVAAAREKLELAKRAVTSAELAPLPTLGVQSQVGYSSAPVLAPNVAVSVSAVLTVPFYDGGYRYGQLRDARAAEEQARAALEATRLAAVVSSARASRSVDVSRADRDVSKSERDLAEKIDMRTREAYARGRGTSLDLVTSAEALRVAEINLAILEFQLAQARANAVLENAECTF
jgi:multidrug efflux system outer membrane protein